MAWIHRLSNVNINELVGDCEHCGVNIKLMFDKTGNRVRCWTGRQKGGRYGKHVLTYKQKVALFGKQEHCPICLKELTYTDAHLDHDHVTGELRGYLCSHCNLGLGKFGDSEEGLVRALEYIRNPPLQRELKGEQG